jgi:hypothetical protein
MVLMGGKWKMENGNGGGRHVVTWFSWVKNGNGNGKWDGQLERVCRNSARNEKRKRKKENNNTQNEATITVTCTVIAG